MVKSLPLLALCLALLGLVPARASAEVLDDANVLKSGKFRFAFEPQIDFGPNAQSGNFLAWGRIGFGIGADADMEVVGGFFRSDTYIGLNIEFMLLRDGSGYPAVSFTGGAHFFYNQGRTNNGYAGIDGTLIVSEEIRDVVHLYLGIDSNVEILPNQFQFPTKAIVGVNIVMNRHFSLIFEVGVNLYQAPHHISGGPVITF